MLVLALALAGQDVPKPTPGICSVAPLYVDAIAGSEELARGPYMTAEQAEAGKRRQADLNTLSRALAARFRGVRASWSDLDGFSSLSTPQIEALARACLALPK